MPKFCLRVALWLIASSLLTVSGTWAQEKLALSPVPSGGFAFAGNWDCEGAFRNNSVHKSTFTGAVVLGGKWLELTEQDVEPATGYVAIYLIGYDAQQKRLVEFDANNFGAAVYASEEGWKTGVLTMTAASNVAGVPAYTVAP